MPIAIVRCLANL